MRVPQAVRWLPALALAAGMAGCDLFSGPEDDGAGPPLTELPRALSASEREVIGASNRFAFDLLREVDARDTASNVFLSPLSASMALGMTMNGARGETFAGMRSALGFGELSQQEINASYRDLVDLLLGLDSSVEMSIANSIWVRRGFPLLDPFVRSSREVFGAEVRELDFNRPDAAPTINGWVKRSTRGRIEEIVDDPIAPDVMLYLINAVYFKGDWTTRFDRKLTTDAPFYLADGGQRTVKMMHRAAGEVRHLWTPEAEIVDLPYGRGAFSMTVVLPGGGRSLQDLVATLDASTWDAWMARLAPRDLEVFLPRFRLEYEQALNESLRALGMEVAFDSRAADFGAMSPLGADLYISNVKQKTYVDVHEEGTEAAGVTSVEIRLVSMPPSFRADRPFLVAIRERFSGTILFLGAVGAPPAG